MPASPAASHEGHRKGAQQAGESAGVRTRRVAGRAAFWRIGARTSAPPNGPNRPSRSAQRHASHAGIHGHPTPGQPPRQPRASEQRTRSAPTHPIRRGAMPTDRVHRHRQQAQTRKREVNTGTTRPPQARRSSTRSGLNATPQNPGLHSHLGPTGGRTNPFMRSWTRHVEHGHPRPHSTHRVNVRIQGPRYPPIGPNVPSNSGTSPGTTTCTPAPHRHRGPPGTPRPPLACV